MCDCPTGFYGKQCELDVDDCYNNECVNGARCLDGPNEYFCDCQPGKRICYNFLTTTNCFINYVVLKQIQIINK